MRAFIEIIIPLLLPALCYWVYLRIQEKRGLPAHDVPLSWLAVLGALLVAAFLAGSWLTGGESPDEHYIPPSVVGGVVVPGHFEPAGTAATP